MKTLLMSYHGLGDNILLTPVWREYKNQNPDTFVGLTYLRRIPVTDLMKLCPYIDEWFAISNPWGDYENFEEGYLSILDETTKYAEANKYDSIIPVTTSPNIGPAHKIHRAALELSIEVTDYRTNMYPNITEDIRKQADKFLEKVTPPYVFVHLKTGNPPKDLNEDMVRPFLEKTSPLQVIEYGSHELASYHLPIGSIPLEMEILRRCSKVICADSFIMHAAGALGIPTTAIFIHTPPEWVIPLHDTPLEIYIKA